MKSILILQNEIMEYRKPVYNALAEDYNVVVLHSGEKSIKEGDRYHEIITSQIPVWRFHLQPRSPLGRIIEGFDAVIAMFDLAWPAYIAPIFLRNRPKFIFWGHRYSRNTLAGSLRDFLMTKADRLLMYGDEEVTRMIERGIDPKKIVVAWNTIHVPNHCDHSQSTKNSLLFVGRLQPMKRVDFIIEAFARLQGIIPDDTVLDIVGSDATTSIGYESSLKLLAEKLDISNKVYFRGREDDPEALAKIFSRAYSYVSPSPVGLGVLHSLAYGIPVITLCNVRHGPEFHNLEQGINAIICSDMGEIEEAMVTVCTNHPYAAQLGRNAYERYANERTLSRMIEGFRKAIDE